MTTVPTIAEEAREIARAMCQGFIAHDDGDMENAASRFADAYTRGFAVDGAVGQKAAQAFVDALAIKDAIDADQDRARRLVDPRWHDVHMRFRDLAATLNIDRRWAFHYCEFWRKHKGEVDYWSDGIEAERYMTARLAPPWLDKRSDGRNGPGALAFLYCAAVEAHDVHTDAGWRLAEGAMALYFEAVLEAR
ncbi:MAG: hypothetical protein AAGA87_06135 [Pseudomonadota bacterium]